jgi:lysophospholipase L1-like esterase
MSEKAIHPLYNGEKTLPEDIIADKEAKYVYICLGLNDLTWAEPENFILGYEKLITKIKARNPDKIIVIMSITPVIDGINPVLTNEKITQANNALIKFAAENGYDFIDYAAAIREETNGLYAELSSDGYCHIKVEGYNRLVEYILCHSVRTAHAETE